MIVIAHRGLATPDRPENTVAAVAAAFDNGADAVEVDVRLTNDGQLAVWHDPDLQRVAGVATHVADAAWARLHRECALRGVPIARAEDVLVAARGRHVVLELKQPPPAPSANARTALAVCGLLKSLQRQAVPLDVTVSSFSPSLAEHVRRLMPPGAAVRTALLGEAFTRPATLLRQALALGHDEIHPHVFPLLVEPQAVTRAHACGVAVVPWTVNRRREVRELVRLGVDGVITDVPGLVRAMRRHPSVTSAGSQRPSTGRRQGW